MIPKCLKLQPLILKCLSSLSYSREEAEVLSLKSQVDIISYWESILLNDPYNFLTSWPKVTFLLILFVHIYKGFFDRQDKMQKLRDFPVLSLWMYLNRIVLRQFRFINSLGIKKYYREGKKEISVILHSTKIKYWRFMLKANYRENLHKILRILCDYYLINRFLETL